MIGDGHEHMFFLLGLPVLWHRLAWPLAWPSPVHVNATKKFQQRDTCTLQFSCRSLFSSIFYNTFQHASLSVFARWYASCWRVMPQFQVLAVEEDRKNVSRMVTPCGCSSRFKTRNNWRNADELQENQGIYA